MCQIFSKFGCKCLFTAPKFRFLGFRPWTLLIIIKTHEGHFLYKTVSCDPLCIEISSAVFDVGKYKNTKGNRRERKVQEVAKSLHTVFYVFLEKPPVNWFKFCMLRELSDVINVHFLVFINLGIKGLRGSKFGISHWNGWSPLEQCFATMQWINWMLCVCEMCLGSGVILCRWVLSQRRCDISVMS